MKRKRPTMNKYVDTTRPLRYNPLVPAMEAICTAGGGEEVEIVLNDPSAFNDLKEYLSERGIGFREIYDGEKMTLQFTR